MAVYIAVSIGVLIVPLYYSWTGCEIALQYSGSTDYLCIPGSEWTWFGPVAILFIPVGVAMTLAVLRAIRFQEGARSFRRVLFILTTSSEVSFILVILGTLFEVAIADEHAGKQCGGWMNGIPPEYQQSCNEARAIASVSHLLLPVQLTLCAGGILLTYLYWKYYNRPVVATL